MRLGRAIFTTAVLAIAFALGGCDTLSNFHLDDWFSSKKPLPGERRAVFPEGVPGVPQGVPPELMGSNQPAEATAALPEPAETQAPAARPPRPQTAAAPPAKPKPKPKPKTDTASTRQPASQSDAASWPAPPPAARPQPAEAPWPSPQQQPAPWPEPRPAGTFSR